MRRLVFLIALPLCAQVQNVPNTTFPAVRALINSNFSWLNTNKAASTHTHTTADISESGNLYFTNARVLSAMAGLYEAPLTFSAPLSRATNAISLTACSDEQIYRYRTATGWTCEAISVTQSQVTGLVDALGAKVASTEVSATPGANQIPRTDSNGVLNVAGGFASTGPWTLSTASQAEPANPASGYRCWYDSAAALIKCKSSAGLVLGSMILPLSAANSNQYAQWTGPDGVQHTKQVAFSELSGSASTAQIPDLSATYEAKDSNIVRKTAANTYTAGMKQVVQPSASTAGGNIACAALPSTPATGDLACDSADGNKMKWWNGSGWQTAGSSATGLGDPGADGIVYRNGEGTSTTASAANVISLFNSGTCSGYPKSDGTCDAGPGAATIVHVINFGFDNGTEAVPVGDIGKYPTVAYACTINRIDISADQSGNLTVEVWKAAGAIPTVSNKISGTSPLTLSGAQLAQNGSIATWTSTTVSSGDVFGFSVTGTPTVNKFTGQIWCQE